MPSPTSGPPANRYLEGDGQWIVDPLATCRDIRVVVFRGRVVVRAADIVSGEAPAVGVIHKAVAVSVDAIAGNFARIEPDIFLQVIVIEVYASVGYRNNGFR